MDPTQADYPGSSTDTSSADTTSSRSSDWPTGVSPSTSTTDSVIGPVNDALKNKDYKDALDKANSAVDDANSRLTDAQAAVDPSLASSNTTAYQSQLKAVDTARNNVTAAEDARARVYETISKDSADNAAKEPDPARQALWTAQSQLAGVHAEQARANIQALNARTADDAQRAQAAIQNANTHAQQVAQTVPAQVQKDVASANLDDVRSAQLPALTASQIQANSARAANYLQTAQKSAAQTQLVQAQTQRTDAQTGLAQADTSKANAQTADINSQTDINNFKNQYIQPQDLQNLVAQGDLTQQKAAYYATLPNLKWADLANREGLNTAKIQQIMANIHKSQVLPYVDNKSPQLAVFNPATGTVTGTPNPAYVDQQSQAISDYQATVKLIQQQIASGQIDPKSADALMSQTYQALQAKIKGTTPADYEKQQQEAAQAQQNSALQALTSGAQEAAGIGNSFMSNAFNLANNKNFTKAPDLHGFDPYAAGAQVVNQGIMGPALSAARSVMATVKPIDPTNPMSFQDALGKTAIAHALNQGAIDPQTAANMLQTAPALGAVLHGAAAANGGNANPQQPPMPQVPAPGQPTGPIIPSQDQGLQSQAQGGGVTPPGTPGAPPGSPGQALLTAANPANNLGQNADYSSLGGSF